ncbi:MAG: Uncharacterized protein G01um10145_471 [Microgenomates group bacterium Gr01-1014_5]|nr:MAG: Uncharacterized protein G01um10145_471 [Microgenomates group bacterium Gr01-1014_5]
MAGNNLTNKVWWNYLTENQRDLLSQSQILLEREEKYGRDHFHDYAFALFPAAKAYEGFLKKLFYDLGIITREQYNSNHFRVGRALNPDLPIKFRGHDWVYDRLSTYCNRETPNMLWDTWRRSRNLVFHWFPRHKNFVTLVEAKKRQQMILEAIEKSLLECKMQ